MRKPGVSRLLGQNRKRSLPGGKDKRGGKQTSGIRGGYRSRETLSETLSSFIAQLGLLLNDLATKANWIPFTITQPGSRGIELHPLLSGCKSAYQVLAEMCGGRLTSEQQRKCKVWCSHINNDINIPFKGHFPYFDISQHFTHIISFDSQNKSLFQGNYLPSSEKETLTWRFNKLKNNKIMIQTNNKLVTEVGCKL